MTPVSTASLMPLSTAGMYSRGTLAAGDAVDELVALALHVGLQLQPHVAILAAPARLAYELALALDGAADGLAVGDLRLCRRSPRR